MSVYYTTDVLYFEFTQHLSTITLILNSIDVIVYIILHTIYLTLYHWFIQDVNLTHINLIIDYGLTWDL